MPTTPRTPPMVYVECDIPEGVTLDDWRRRHVRPERRSPVVAGMRRLRYRAAARP